MAAADATADCIGSLSAAVSVVTNFTVVVAGFITPETGTAALSDTAGGVVAAGVATVVGLAKLESSPVGFTVTVEETGSTAASEAVVTPEVGVVEDTILVDGKRGVVVTGTVVHEDMGAGEEEACAS